VRQNNTLRQTGPTNAPQDDGYEVEQILEARVCRRKLQYRVKWLGYEDDLAWYDASNFKNTVALARSVGFTPPTLPVQGHQKG
jgi:hypothetical protein